MPSRHGACLVGLAVCRRSRRQVGCALVPSRAAAFNARGAAASLRCRQAAGGRGRDGSRQRAEMAELLRPNSRGPVTIDLGRAEEFVRAGPVPTRTRHARFNSTREI